MVSSQSNSCHCQSQLHFDVLLRLLPWPSRPLQLPRWLLQQPNIPAIDKGHCCTHAGMHEQKCSFSVSIQNCTLTNCSVTLSPLSHLVLCWHSVKLTMWLRLPSVGQCASDGISQYKNKNGYSADAMKDLQRVWAYLSMLDGADPPNLDHIEKVTSAGFGTRVVVPMSSQSEWRQGSGTGASEEFWDKTNVEHWASRSWKTKVEALGSEIYINTGRRDIAIGESYFATTTAATTKTIPYTVIFLLIIISTYYVPKTSECSLQVCAVLSSMMISRKACYIFHTFKLINLWQWRWQWLNGDKFCSYQTLV